MVLANEFQEWWPRYELLCVSNTCSMHIGTITPNLTGRDHTNCYYLILYCVEKVVNCVLRRIMVSTKQDPPAKSSPRYNILSMPGKSISILANVVSYKK